MNLPTKFHRNRHCINGALDRTDIQTDKHIDGKSENKGRKQNLKIFYFLLHRLPNKHTNIHTDKPAGDNGPILK